MKKSKIVVALAAVFVGGAAIADGSSVTLYGRVNTTYEYQSQKFDRTITNVTNNVGAEDTANSYSQKFSGLAQRNNSSRFGLKGSEDLGNGLAATFKVEQGFNSDVGGGGTIGSRKAWVGVEGKNFGTLRFGADNAGDLSPFYAQFDDNTIEVNHDTGRTGVWYSSNLSYLDVATPVGTKYDPTSSAVRWASSTPAVLGFAAGKFSSTFGYASGGNNLSYVSPSFSGFSVGFRVGFTGPNNSIASNGQDLGAGRETDSKIYDLTFDYNNSALGLYVGAGLQATGGKGGTYTTGTTRTLESQKATRFQLVGSYSLPQSSPLKGLTFAGIVGVGKDKFKSHTDVISAADGSIALGNSNDDYSFKNSLRYFQIGAMYKPADVGIDVGGNYAFQGGKLTGTDYNGTTALAGDWADDSTYTNRVKRHQFQVAAGYNFSKRTRVYGFLDYQKTTEKGNYRGVNSTSIGGADLSDDGKDWKGTVKQTTLGVGLRHNF